MRSVKFEWSTLWCVGAVFVNISFTDTLNRAIFIEKQLHISAVYDHHQAINTVFYSKVKCNK